MSDERFRLSAQNTVACFGFVIMSAIGMHFAWDSKCAQPLNILFNAQKARATLNDEYMERQRSQRGIRTTSYQVSYKFTAGDGKEYRGSSVTGDEPDPVMDVWYMPKNPGHNGMELKGHAYIDFGIFAIMAIAFIGSAGALALHFKNGAGAQSDEIDPGFRSGR
jgi:hypothetical protein